ncbi:unnamed protein product [Darwinula stevensoni]|uniref:Uncharacterized protein n=1 Tax=Darwinula stevensoni TaxID=69355 RepID=A0A7R8XD80_9CRUS|nr:unnamed protein product [Darwinula stevensoni]CAG0892768.1 unnamed protein product [Darwinula stevensoni]
MASSVIVIGSFPMIFLGLTSWSFQVRYAWYIIFIILFQFGWAAVQISHLALMPNLTQNSEERAKLNTYRYSELDALREEYKEPEICQGNPIRNPNWNFPFGLKMYGMLVLSNILPYILVWLVLGIAGGSGNQTVVLIGVGIGTVFTIVFHMLTPERVHSANNPFSISADGRKNFRIQDWFTKLQFYQTAVLYMASRLFCNLVQSFINLYLQITLHMPAESVAIIPLVIFLSGFFSTFLIERSNEALGRVVTFTIGGVLGMTASVWVSLGVASENFQYQVYTIAVLYGYSTTAVVVTALNLTADLIGKQEHTGGFVYGFMSFTDKLASGIAIWIIEYCVPYCSNSGDYVPLPLIGGNRMASCESVENYYRKSLALGAGSALLLALSALATIHFSRNMSPSDPQRYREILQVSPIEGASRDLIPLEMNQEEYV